ncbi:hypothetical protein AB4124_03695 [Paenibacillus sp. 2KB_20]|uniref:hypothetical protein n=1 Tax=Paenibacillus sp. 2KB_20 TaxID=3232977 RepID=UPI003F985AC4
MCYATGSIEKWGDRWEERREEHQLNELIPLVPDYLSKIPDEDIYFSRFTFGELVVKQQKLMTELNLLFGAVAVVGVFFTAGGSLYLLAIANGVWGVAQIGVSTMKLRDLNDGVVSDTSFLGINQEMLDVTGVMLGAVDLAILGKTLLKGANKAANNKYMKGIDQVSPPKTRFKRGQDRRQKEMAMRVRQAVEESRAIRRASKDKRDLYFKKEKELYEASKKKKTSSSGSLGGAGEVPHIKSIEPRGEPIKFEPIVKQEKLAQKTYDRLRGSGLDMNELEVFSKNTGLSLDEAIELKKHLFLTEHVNMPDTVSGKYYYTGYFHPDMHIAYGWEKALKGELEPRQLADHELAESKLMQDGIPYRKIESWNPKEGLTGRPPNQGAHDLAPPPPKDFPEFSPDETLL